MLWFLFLLIVLVFTAAVLDRLFRYPVERLDDLIALIRPTRECEVEELFDVRREGELRAKLSAREFRAEQRKRMVKAFEYLRCRSYNGLAITRLAYAEWQRLQASGEPRDQARMCVVQEIIQAGMEFRIYSSGALPKAALCVLLRADKWPLATPSMADLREAGEIDGIHAYYRLTTAVGYLSLFYGQKYYDDLMTRLHGRVPSV